jgi:hypothetical protein
MNLIWFDVQIENRVAMLRANFFTGVNTGSSIYRMGFLCLIGIAHLPESLQHLKYYKNFEIRPVFTTDI